MFNRILVPVDGSESSEKSVARAVEIAELCKAKIYFLYVANINQIAINPNLMHAIIDAMRAAGTAILERAAGMIPENVECEKIMETGAPAAVILEYEEILDADLIVMGSRGLGVVKGVLLGSVSQYIIERAKGPVMVVK